MTSMSQAGYISQPVATSETSGSEVGIFELANIIRPTVPFTLATVTVSVGGAVDPHSHGVREIWMLTHGRGLLTIDGERSVAQAGDVLYFESHQSHQITNDGDLPLRFLSIWWQP